MEIQNVAHIPAPVTRPRTSNRALMGRGPLAASTVLNISSRASCRSRAGERTGRSSPDARLNAARTGVVAGTDSAASGQIRFVRGIRPTPRERFYTLHNGLKSRFMDQNSRDIESPSGAMEACNLLASLACVSDWGSGGRFVATAASSRSPRG